jgi:hypothetical protein
MKAFGLSEAEPIQLNSFEDTNSTSEMVLSEPITTAPPQHQKENSIEDEDSLSTLSTNAKAPTNSFRDRSRMTPTHDENYQNSVRVQFFILTKQVNDTQKMNKMLSANDVTLHVGETVTFKDTFVHEWNGHFGSYSAWHQGTLILTNYRLIFKPSSYSTYVSYTVQRLTC